MQRICAPPSHRKKLLKSCIHAAHMRVSITSKKTIETCIHALHMRVSIASKETLKNLHSCSAYAYLHHNIKTAKNLQFRVDLSQIANKYESNIVTNHPAIENVKNFKCCLACR